MKILSLETSTKQFSLATTDGDKIIKSRSTVLKKVLSDSIIPSIEKILKGSRLKLSEIDVFVIGLGPGSFTSLRVGMSTIKGLAFALQKPLLGVNSLDAIAANALKVAKNGEDICVVVDAKRNLVYACIYGQSSGGLKQKSGYLLINIRELLAKIKANTVFVGDGIALYKNEIENAFRNAKVNVSFAAEKTWFPEARQLVALGQERINAQKFDDIDKLVPVYLYPEDCQVQK